MGDSESFKVKGQSQTPVGISELTSKLEKWRGLLSSLIQKAFKKMSEVWETKCLMSILKCFF